MSELGKIYQESYFKEIERKDRIEAALSTQIGISAIVLGAIYTLSKTITHQNCLIYALQYFSLTISAASLIVTIFFISFAIWSYKGKYIPHVSLIEKHRESLIAFYDKQGAESTSSDKADKETQTFVYSEFAACTESHAKINAKKAKFSMLSKATLLLAIIFLTIAAAPSFFSQM